MLNGISCYRFNSCDSNKKNKNEMPHHKDYYQEKITTKPTKKTTSKTTNTKIGLRKSSMPVVKSISIFQTQKWL